jgi:FkbM family methyltransferase
MAIRDQFPIRDRNERVSEDQRVSDDQRDSENERVSENHSARERGQVAVKDAIRPYVITGRRLLRGDLRLSDIGYARRVSYSQYGEDLWLSDYFSDQPIGFYVDIGAYDPFDASNTLLLSRRGWCGINIEPDPGALARLRRFRRRDTNLGFAISDRDGQSTFVLAGSLSGLDAPGYPWPDRSAARIRVRTRRLDDVLAEHRPAGEIDLLDIDCEGHDLVVLQSNDWQRFRPRVILAEHRPGANDELRRFLSEVGYRRLRQFDLTLAFERES